MTNASEDTELNAQSTSVKNNSHQTNLSPSKSLEMDKMTLMLICAKVKEPAAATSIKKKTKKKHCETPPLGPPNDFQAPALQFNPIPLQQADFITTSSEGRADEMNTIKGACKQSEAGADLSFNSGPSNHLK